LFAHYGFLDMTDSDTKVKRIPRGAKLPVASLADVQPIAQALSELAAPASAARIASQINRTVSGPFKGLLAAAKYFGVIKKEGDKLVLTERGESFLAGDTAAKRSAVMGTGFGPIIGSFSSKRVNEAAIEARLQDDWSVPEGSAPDLRKVLVDSAQDAGLIANSKFDPAAIESVPEEDVSSVTKPSSNSTEKSGRNGSSGGSSSSGKKPASGDKERPVDPPQATTSPVQVVVQVDASKLEPEQIGELIRALQQPK
jgi:hypothetical protein